MLLINRFYVLVLILALAASGNAADIKTAQTVQGVTGLESAAGPATAAPGKTGDESLQSGSQQAEQTFEELQQQLSMEVLGDPWTGDFETMVEHRVIRVLTVYDAMRYYIDKGMEKGMTYEWFKLFENFVNERLRRKHLRVHLVFFPLARNELIPALLAGRGDIVAAGLTITPERAEVVQFSDPVTRDMSEVLVTGPSAPKIESLEDLAGTEIYVRNSSSYRASIDTLNEQFGQQGQELIKIVNAQEQLEDEDILEMVNAGLIDWTVVDDYKARIWAEVFENLTVREDLVFRSGGRIGFAMRFDSPGLAELLNEFIKTHKQGSLQGNLLINRYLKNIDWARNALEKGDYRRFEETVDIFRKYGLQYGIDYLMVAAQGYQESRLDQNARSGAGAIGVMQLLPTTAADANVGITDITNVDSNIHAGIKYLNFIRDRYFSDPGVDTFNQTMFAFAAYNAGPARVRTLREKAAGKGYDPNIWFDNVEVIAAEDIGRETVQYVANILKYYVAYNMSLQQRFKKQQARERAGID